MHDELNDRAAGLLMENSPSSSAFERSVSSVSSAELLAVRSSVSPGSSVSFPFQLANKLRCGHVHDQVIYRFVLSKSEFPLIVTADRRHCDLVLG
jgi:hypothetical protein